MKGEEKRKHRENKRMENINNINKLAKINLIKRACIGQEQNKRK